MPRGVYERKNKMTEEERKAAAKASKAKYYAKNKEERKAVAAARYLERKKDPEFIAARKEYNQKRYQENRERLLNKSKKYNSENKEKRNARRKVKRDTDPAYRLRCSVSHMVKEAVKRSNGAKGGSTFKHLPYSLQELKESLESKFTEGMSWDNYGEWHIDHIIPQAKLNYDSLTHPNFQKCWALNNLQPLWAKDNIRKGSLYRGKRHSYK